MGMTIREACDSTGGGITRVLKMPCWTYNVPARACHVGGRLRATGLAQLRETGHTDILCAMCYAHKGQFTFPGVDAAQEKRLAAIADPRWIEAMIVLITARSPQYFRWHSSGDLQSLEHLRKIALVCEGTPDTKHWLPTQERGILRQYEREYGALPANLTVRESAIRIVRPGAAPIMPASGRPASTASAEPIDGAYNCPAPQQNNHCGSCRACWDADVKLVCYHLH